MFSDLPTEDQDQVANLLAQYYDWHTDKDKEGLNYAEIMSLELKQETRKELVVLMHNLDEIMDIIQPAMKKRGHL